MRVRGDNAPSNAFSLEEQGKTIPSLQQQVADLETDKAALTEKVTSLEGQVTDTQMALCDVYEQIVAVTSTTGGA